MPLRAVVDGVGPSVAVHSVMSRQSRKSIQSIELEGVVGGADTAKERIKTSYPDADIVKAPPPSNPFQVMTDLRFDKKSKVLGTGGKTENEAWDKAFDAILDSEYGP